MNRRQLRRVRLYSAVISVRVNDDDMHDGSDPYFQWLAVDPTNGWANVIFYDGLAGSTRPSHPHGAKLPFEPPCIRLS